MTDATLSAKVTADIADFTKKFDDMKGSIDRLGQQVQSPASAAASAAGAIEASTGRWKTAFLAVGTAVAAGAGVAVQAIAQWTSAAAQAAEQTEHIAQQTGIAAQTLEGWSVALNRVGLDVESFSLGFKALSKDIVKAQASADFSTTTFAKLGLTINQLGSTEEVIRHIADRFAAMPDGAQKAQLAIDLFGRAGLKLIPLLNQGAAGLDAATQKARDFGLVLDSSARTQLVQYDDALDDLGKAWDGLKTQVAIAAAPILLKAVELTSSAITMAVRIVGAIREMVAGAELAFARLGDVLLSVRAKTDAVAGFFKGLYDAVVGRSYIPDMVDDIGRQMQLLDVAMTAPARNATANTGRMFEGLAFTAQSAMNQLVSTINFSWGSATQTVSNALAQMTTKQIEWGQVGIQIGQQFLGAMINQILQLMTQWALATVFAQAQNVLQTTAHGAAEAAKTTITATNEAARLGITLATNKAIMAGTIVSLASIAAVGGASLAVMEAVVVVASAFFAAMAAALTATVVGAPLAPAFVAAAAVMASAGTAAVVASAAAIQAALGTAIVATTAALATPFAAGGAVFGPTLALVGEHATRSNPEFIGHANQLGLAGGRTPIIHTHVFLNNREIAVAVSDGQISALRTMGAL